LKIVDVDGLVLQDTNYSESSKILNVFTKEYGLIGVISKGSRNVKSKLRSVSRKLIYGTFHIYYKENGLSTLISVDIKNSYSNIISNLTSISYASYVIDLVRQVIRENNSSDIYDLVIATLNKIDEGLDPLVLTNILELKLLEYLGVKPSIDSCSICGSVNNIVSLSSSNGGFLCKNCYSTDLITSEKTIKMIRMYYYVDISKISKLDVSEEVKKDINLFLDDYYDRYTGLYLKSRKFIKDLEKLNV